MERVHEVTDVRSKFNVGFNKNTKHFAYQLETGTALVVAEDRVHQGHGHPRSVVLTRKGVLKGKCNLMKVFKGWDVNIKQNQSKTMWLN